MRRRPAILVTGFGPFPGQPRNASSLLAEAVAETAAGRLAGFAIEAETLPTEWRSGPGRLEHLLETLRPVVALHFGVSRRAKGFVVETRARNAASETLDACGERPPARCVAWTGPQEVASTFPSAQIVDRLRRLSLPVQISRDAGGYLCNTILYHSLSHARRPREDGFGPRHGFIHIPDRLIGSGVRAASRPAAASRLDWQGAVEGGVAILAVCAGVIGKGAGR